MNFNQKSFLAFIGLLLIVSVVGLLLTNKPLEINTNTETQVRGVAGITSSQIKWNNVPLIDSTVVSGSICYAERNGMRVEVNPCTAQDIDARDIEQNVNFTWKGANPQNVGWIFVYDGDLRSGKVEVDRMVTRDYEQKRIVNDYVNNYLVSGVQSYVNLTYVPPSCDLGNLNNTRFYNVTFIGNSTAKTVCFTTITTINSTAFRISGNYDKEETYTIQRTQLEKVDVTDRFVKISNPLNDNRSYYKVDEVLFNPSQSINTHWTYTPKDRTNSGKWHILGYNSDIGLVQSIVQDQYLYLDPWWSGGTNWAKKKLISINTTDSTSRGNLSVLINITFDSDMQTDFDDLRFVDAEEDAELGYWFYNNTYIASNSVQVWVKMNRNISSASNTSIYMYYANPSASTTSDIDNAFDFADDFDTLDWSTKWQSANQGLYSVSGGKLLAASVGTSANDLISSNRTFNGFIAEVRTATDTTTNDGWYFLPHQTAKTYSGAEGVQTQTGAFRMAINSGFTSGGTPADNKYYLWKAIFPPSTSAIRFNVTNDYPSLTQLLTASGTPSGYTKYVGFLRYNAGTGYVDWITVRPYVTAEPTYTFGAEEMGVSLDIVQTIPIDNLNTTNTSINFSCNYTSSGQNITKAGLYINSSFDNSDAINVNNYTYSYQVDDLPEGTYRWYCYGEGSLGINGTSTNRTFTIDSLPPTIVASNITSISSTTLPVSSWWNTTITDPHYDSCWYFTSENFTNVTFGCPSTSRRQTNWTSYGLKWINIFANDTFGNSGNVTYSLSISNISIVANTPNDPYRTNNPSITFNCTANYNPASSSANISLYIDGIRNETLTSSCGSSCTYLSIQTTKTLEEASHTWYCKAENNDNGDVAITTSRVIIVDVTKPVVVAYNITNISGVQIPQSKWWVSINDTNRQACWYHTFDSPYTNTTISCAAVPATPVSTTWTSYGNKGIKLYANDSAGNFNNATYYLSVTNISATLNSPANNSLSSTATPTLSCTANFDPSASGRLEIFLDSISVSTIEAVGTSIGGSKVADTLSQGNHTWYCVATNYDSGTISTSPISTFTVDSVAPSISVTNATNQTSLSNNMKTNMPISVTDATTTPYCQYNSTENATYTTIGCTGTIRINWTSPGYKVVQIRANDSANNIAYSIINLQAKQYQTEVNYSSGITEGESAVFTLRMNSTPIPLGSEYADLIYNGVNEGFDSRSIVDTYTSIITNTINIPSDAGNLTGKPVSFYWNLTTPNLQTNLTNQTVYSLSIDNCTINTQLIYNFSINNENTKALLSTGTGTNISTTMEAIMYSTQDESIRWVSNTTSSNVNSFQLCVNTGWLSTSLATYLDLDITYDADGYYYERFNEQRTSISNSTVPKYAALYLLPDTSTSNKAFKINVKDANLIPVQNAVVEIYRYIPGTDTSIIIESPVTDDLGNAVGHMVLADAVYKIVIRKAGVVLGTFNKISTTETSTCNSIYSDCFLNLQLVTTSNQFSQFDNMLGIYYNYSYNQDTRVITLSFVSADTSAKAVSLNVTTYYGSEAVCNEESTAVSDVLTCSIPSNVNGTVVATTKVGNSVLSVILNKVTPRETFGDISSLRYLLVGLLIPMFVIMGASSAALALVFMLIGLVLIFVSGLLQTNAWVGGSSAIIWLIVSVIILLLKIRKGGQQNG